MTTKQKLSRVWNRYVYWQKLAHRYNEYSVKGIIYNERSLFYYRQWSDLKVQYNYEQSIEVL